MRLRATEAAMVMAPDAALHAGMRQPGQRVAIVLEPRTHPELGVLHIDDDVFAIGRSEAPFDGYPPDAVAGLSRRHARIFVEDGAAYLADLGSKNGTTVNGAATRQAIARLHDGDEINLGGTLCYAVRLGTKQPGPAPRARLAGLILQPQRPGLEEIVLTHFPFLVSKIDQTFFRYHDAQPHQVGYLSRRHAHIFVKGGVPCVEDLGSTNGTFIGAVRLDERAHELQEGDELAFGGRHFVYRVSLQWEQAAPDPTLTRVATMHAGRGGDAGDTEKTTFVAAAGSFLDIFCVEREDARQPDESVPAPGAGHAEPAGAWQSSLRRSKFIMLAAGMLEALNGAGEAGERNLSRLRRTGGALLVLVLAGGLGAYLAGAPERQLAQLMAKGNYPDAAALAGQRLGRDPDNAELRAQGTEALLKAGLPRWIGLMKERRYEQAAGAVARMHELGRNNVEVGPLIAEVDWIGQLAQFVSARGGPEAPSASPADRARIRLLLQQWQDDAAAHQRASANIAALVPAFRDTYAQALSDLRKLALVDASQPGANSGNGQ
jgi:pSer/pThr/pTyr-binding forkhead associated (FHA) protein